MTAIPLLLLVLASGVFLLIHAESKGLGGIYKLLSWLIILLSILLTIGGVARGIIRHRNMTKFRTEHPEFFRERGHGFGRHHGFGGHGPGDWKPGAAEPADSTVKTP